MTGHQARRPRGEGHEAPTQRMAGVFPIAPTPFTETGDLDLAGQRRVRDCMIDHGVEGICILANYSEQFLLSDAERDVLLDLCLSHVAGRVPAIVACSHFSTRIAIERARAAASAGASMLMPPYHGTALRADDAGSSSTMRASRRGGPADVVARCRHHRTSWSGRRNPVDPAIGATPVTVAATA
jgi:hypothetical protein